MEQVRPKAPKGLLSFAREAVVACALLFVVGELIIRIAIPSLPIYQEHARLTSPDGRFDYVILEGDVAAFVSFFYRGYVVPHGTIFQHPGRRSRGLFGGWKGDGWLVYRADDIFSGEWRDKSTLILTYATAGGLHPVVQDYRPYFYSDQFSAFGTPYKKMEGMVVLVVEYLDKAKLADIAKPNQSTDPTLASGTSPARQESRLR